ncbi:hypothetical protein GF325_04845 [Candidatus Bathyarchaeota archaeon]|nr:hypothetical protein [Candidatus Bathyarchaeota archaeon]
MAENENTAMEDTKDEEADDGGLDVEKVNLKSYSKIILFYPLLVYSLIAMVIKVTGEGLPEPDRPGLAIIWIFIFFINASIVGFDFPAVKFFVLFLIIVIVIMAIILLDNAGIINFLAFWQGMREFFDMSLDSRFYAWMSIALGFLIGVAFLQGQLNYVVIEKNELYVNKVVRGQADRYPTSNLRVKMDLVDIFEFLTLGAGRIKLIVDGEDSFDLKTIPLVKKKKRHIDELLSATLIEKEE